MESVRVRQRRALSRWLEEWKIDRVLTAATEPGRAVVEVAADDTVSRCRCDQFSSGGGVVPAVGQVRLLPPVDAGGMHERPVYVLVVECAGIGQWRVAPFSRFGNPATPGEWMTGLRALPMRVLCLWNVRVVGQDMLGAAWFCRSVSAAQVGRVLVAYRQVREGLSAGAALSGRFGPPLEHPLDPRHGYLQEERALLDVSLGERGSGAEQDDVFCYEAGESERRKAAEGVGEYGGGTKPEA
jgi:hypothetical protein